MDVGKREGAGARTTVASCRSMDSFLCWPKWEFRFSLRAKVIFCKEGKPPGSPSDGQSKQQATLDQPTEPFVVAHGTIQLLLLTEW